MIPSIPILDDLVILKPGDRFRSPGRALTTAVLNYLEKNLVDLIGTNIMGDNTYPLLLLSSGNKPIFFTEGGVYLKDNPIPYIVRPIKLSLFDRPFWIYQIYFL